MSQINILGPVGYNPTGEYDNTHKYDRLDVVYYEGSSYVALQESIGQLPTNTDYWDCIAGQKTISGTTVERPSDDLWIGLVYFDTTLGKPVWWDGTNWVDATGTQV